MDPRADDTHVLLKVPRRLLEVAMEWCRSRGLSLSGSDALVAFTDGLQEHAGDQSARMFLDSIVENIPDMIFVIDTTASMTPVIHDLALSMRSIVRVLERMVPSVRIGISAYKDHDIPLPPVITFPLTATDPYLPRIVGFIESLDASPVGSRSIDEDVHLGLEAATLMRWRSDAKQVMVLIGDAEAHPENQNQTFWQVRNFVQANKLRAFSTLFVTTPSSLSAGNVARAYFQALAKVYDAAHPRARKK